MQPKLAAAGILAMLSGVVSYVFFDFGKDMALDATAPFDMRVFGAFLILYSLINIVLLLCAWHFIDYRIEKAARYCVLVMLAAIIFSTTSDGVEAAEETGLFLAFLMLFVNWLAIRRAIDSQIDAVRLRRG